MTTHPPVSRLRSSDIASTSLFYLDRPTTNRPPTPSADDLEIT